MRRHTLSLFCVFLSIVVCGCSSDSKETIAAVPDSECNEQTQPECSSNTERKVCEDGKFAIKLCDSGETCRNGECVKPQDDTDCSPENYKVVCDVSGEARIVCSQAGKTVREECPDGYRCLDGECRASCTDALMGSCEGDVATRCENSLVIHEDCAAKGMACAVGNCVPLTAACVSETFKVKCNEAGDAQIVCRGGLEAEEPCQDGEKCEGGVCQNPGETCVDGTSLCLDDHSFKKCEGGSYVLVYCEAETVCRENECEPVDDPDKCLGNEPMCGDSEHLIECRDGRRVTVPCEDGKVCDKDACTKPLVPGSDCDDTFAQYCLDEMSAAVCQEGTVVSVPCGDKICHQGKCADKPCGEDFTAECVGDDSLRVCRENVVKVEKCEGENVCLNGECRALGEGDACKPDVFSNVCLNETDYYVCGESETIEKKSCDATQICLNGMCSECDPENFEKTCDPDDDTKNSFFECVEDEMTPGRYVKKAQACPKSQSLCLDGTCVECDPGSYKAHCTGNAESKCSADGRLIVTPCEGDLKCVEGFDECTSKCSTEADCPTRDDGLKYLCVSNKCELQTECSVSSDKPTCSGDKRKVCQDPGKWVEVDCDGGKVCQGQGECVACTKDSHCTGGMVCDVPTHTCVACNADRDCSGSQVCDVTTHTCVACNSESDCGGTKTCLNHACVDCNPATFGTQCVDNAPATCNSAGTIVKSAACSGEKPTCVDGICAVCNAAEDLDKVFSCSYPGYEGYAAICKGNNNVTVKKCADNQKCVVGEGCVSKCGDFSGCANIDEAQYCDASGNLVKVPCWPGVCSTDGGTTTCTDVCSGNIDKCGEYNGVDVLRTCKDNKVKVIKDSSGAYFCGTVDGVVGWHEECSVSNAKYGLDRDGDCQVWSCKANAVQDYKGTPKNGYVVESSGAICIPPDEDGVDISMSCYKTADNVAMGQFIVCDTTAGATCSNGICSNWGNVTSSLSAENKAKAPFGMCEPISQTVYNYYKIGSSYYFDTYSCTNFRGGNWTNPKCKTVNDDRNQPRAVCDHTLYDPESGLTVDLAGTCKGKNRYHLALFRVGSTFGADVYYQMCENSCKTTSTGFAYCGN